MTQQTICGGKYTITRKLLERRPLTLGALSISYHDNQINLGLIDNEEAQI